MIFTGFFIVRLHSNEDMQDYILHMKFHPNIQSSEIQEFPAVATYIAVEYQEIFLRVNDTVWRFFAANTIPLFSLWRLTKNG